MTETLCIYKAAPTWNGQVEPIEAALARATETLVAPVTYCGKPIRGLKSFTECQPVFVGVDAALSVHSNAFDPRSVCEECASAAAELIRARVGSTVTPKECP